MSAIKLFHKIAVIAAVAFLILLISLNLQSMHVLSLAQLLLVGAFPIAAAWYTFKPGFFKLIKIRQVGWLKPFVVGLTWMGWVTIYPVIIWQVQRHNPLTTPVTSLVLLCAQNFLFFSINAIIFDIKDYRTDSYHHLKTYPVLLGVRNTFRFIVLPLTVINLLVFFLFQTQHNFTFLQVLIQLIPYLVLVLVIAKYRNGRSVLYYLAAVDGLVFLKAVCGITSILLIKK